MTSVYDVHIEKKCPAKGSHAVSIQQLLERYKCDAAPNMRVDSELCLEVFVCEGIEIQRKSFR